MSFLDSNRTDQYTPSGYVSGFDQNLLTSPGRHRAKNRYYRHSRISEDAFCQILRCFSDDLTATEAAGITGISVRSVNSIYLKLRRSLSNVSASDTTNCAEVFTLHVQEQKIGVKASRLHSGLEVLLHSATAVGDLNNWRSLGTAQALVGTQCSRPKRRPNISTAEHLVLDSFWQYASQRLPRFNGIHKHTLNLHMQETAYRFNMRSENMYYHLLERLGHDPI
ncbi:MAG: hypothetical protein V7711_15460 [Pseudomonadales bacterium]